MQKTNKQIYLAGEYARLSKEDFHNASKQGNPLNSQSNESNSIKSQRELIHHYVSGKPDIQIIRSYEDDGYTGLNFNRPGFKAMLKDIQDGVINCVIVKDYSRLGRDHIETGKYLKKIFPRLNVRFISINDDYDSVNQMRPADHILMPFKNLMNDTSSRDTSIKVRSHLEVKQINGELTAAFAVYGYEKQQVDNQNKLVVDEYAAGVVKEIFLKVLQGYSLQSIAEQLNSDGILSPLEYKKYRGSAFYTGFKVKTKAMWDAVSVRRIVSNRVYIGVLEQGKREKINYKVNERIIKPEEEWRCKKDAHEAIIDMDIFWIAQELLALDTRRGPDKERLYPFSGLLRCADCDEIMVRKSETHRGKRYSYYVCSTNKKDKNKCSSHRINEEKLKVCIANLLRDHIKVLKDINVLLPQLRNASIAGKQIKKIQDHLLVIDCEQQEKVRLKVSLYEDYKRGFLDETDYKDMAQMCKSQIEDANKQKKRLKEQVEELKNRETIDYNWVERTIAFEDEKILDRLHLVLTIKYIRVYSNCQLEMVLRKQDEFTEILEYIENNISPEHYANEDLNTGGNSDGEKE